MNKKSDSKNDISNTITPPSALLFLPQSRPFPKNAQVFPRFLKQFSQKVTPKNTPISSTKNPSFSHFIYFYSNWQVPSHKKGTDSGKSNIKRIWGAADALLQSIKMH